MTIVRVRKHGYDENGDPIAGEPDRKTLVGAFDAPASSSDITDRGRDGVVVDRIVFGKYGADVVHSDQLEVNGVLFDVVGEPAQWKNPLTGSTPGCEIALKRAAG